MPSLPLWTLAPNDVGLPWLGQMLDMFRRDTDPKEYYHYYALPVATLLGGYTYAQMTGAPPDITLLGGYTLPSINTPRRRPFPDVNAGLVLCGPGVQARPT